MSAKEKAIAKVKELVAISFEGDYKKAFEYYDMNHDGEITKDELMTLLMNAQVGNWLTRDTYAREALKVLDLDKDGGVSWDEFQKAVVKEG